MSDEDRLSDRLYALDDVLGRLQLIITENMRLKEENERLRGEVRHLEEERERLVMTWRLNAMRESREEERREREERERRFRWPWESR